MKKLSKNNIITIALIIAIYAIVFVLEKVIDPNSMLFIVLKKGAIYALVAVSMNLLNGFTGLFSLGQAGFMLIGAYTYAIFTIPVEYRDAVYQYFDGGIVQFSIPVIPALILAGLVAALFAFLIGLPVLRLKSDSAPSSSGILLAPSPTAQTCLENSLLSIPLCSPSQ